MINVNLSKLAIIYNKLKETNNFELMEIIIRFYEVIKRKEVFKILNK